MEGLTIYRKGLPVYNVFMYSTGWQSNGDDKDEIFIGNK